MSLALTRIRLHGFKTFAQRVEIELGASLTAVVGPNGCGKSNLVDALVWALGEANVRTLRAQTPTEVLFSGSAAHKPLGLAEVSLWFNNETRWLPLDADEVQSRAVCTVRASGSAGLTARLPACATLPICSRARGWGAGATQ
jgi:condensin subunit Smc